jgi:hypothetical protein
LRPQQLKAKDLRAWAIVPIRAIKDPRMTPATLRVLVAYCSYADAMGRTFVSQPRIGQDIGMGKTGVSYHAVKLRKLGYITYCKPFFRGQRSTSNRIVYDPSLKLEESIRARLTTRQQIQLGEAEERMKQEHTQAKSGPNMADDLDLSKLRADFQCLTADFFSRAKGAGWWISPDIEDRAAIMLANQAVELLREPHSDETEAA